MNIKGTFTGRMLKVTTQTLLEQFRQRKAGFEAGNINFALEFQITSQSDIGTLDTVEGSLNSLVGAVRALSDNATFDTQIVLHPVVPLDDELTRETQRLVQAQIEVIETAPQKRLVLPGSKP